jgi:hypothetical protein
MDQPAGDRPPLAAGSREKTRADLLRPPALSREVSSPVRRSKAMCRQPRAPVRLRVAVSFDPSAPARRSVAMHHQRCAPARQPVAMHHQRCAPVRPPVAMAQRTCAAARRSVAKHRGSAPMCGERWLCTTPHAPRCRVRWHRAAGSGAGVRAVYWYASRDSRGGCRGVEHRVDASGNACRSPVRCVVAPRKSIARRCCTVRLAAESCSGRRAFKKFRADASRLEFTVQKGHGILRRG